MIGLGFDTSNYTTSAAWFDGSQGGSRGRLLEVKEGALGLRQSDSLFQHVKQLPFVVNELMGNDNLDISAVGASTRPRSVEGSYMPCFLAGASAGRVLAGVLQVPFYSFSHQEGHIAAAAWSAGRMDLLDRLHLAWHLSGGTTELLLVEPVPEGGVNAMRIGGSDDLSAGQLIDRAGVRLGFSFPAGKTLDVLSQKAEKKAPFPVKVRNLTFSLSGVENQINALIESGGSGETVAYFVLNTIARAVETATKQAMIAYPGLPLLCSGGVSANSFIRRVLLPYGAIFAAPDYARDNAMGVAVLTCRRWNTEHHVS
ncbi:MAG: DNA-binding protein [Oscillospiraceae bacterium]|nr:DNA-binding protein [Oscillospiraceae bacterium]